MKEIRVYVFSLSITSAFLLLAPSWRIMHVVSFVAMDLSKEMCQKELKTFHITSINYLYLIIYCFELFLHHLNIT